MRLLWGLTYTFIVMIIIAIDTFLTSLYVIIVNLLKGATFVINWLAKRGVKNG